MPPEQNPSTDRFRVIGFKPSDILRQLHIGVLLRLGKSEPKQGTKLIEVYSVDATTDRGSVARYGNYQAVYFLNDTAFDLCEHYKLELPRVTSMVTRAELPSVTKVVVKQPSPETW